MTQRTNEPWELHPDEYQQDLNPHGGAGMNAGLVGNDPVRAGGVRSAYDIKGLHRRLEGFEDDDLKQIPVLPSGTRLEQGATYIDLRADDCREFKAMGSDEAAPNNWYVPKSDVPYPLWNRLIGVDNPERTNEQDD